MDTSRTIRTTGRVKGMTCDHCVRAVREELSRLEGVAAVDVDLASGRISLDSDRPVDAGALRAAVEEAGYELAAGPDRSEVDVPGSAGGGR